MRQPPHDSRDKLACRTHDGFLAYGSDSGPTMTGIGAPPAPDSCFSLTVSSRIRSYSVPAFLALETTLSTAYVSALSAESRPRVVLVVPRSSPSAQMKTNGAAKGDSIDGVGKVDLDSGEAAMPLEKASEMTAGS